MDSTVVFLHSQCGWCFEIVFWMIWVLRSRLYLTFIRKKYDNLMSEVMWFRRYASVLKQLLCGFNNWVVLAVRWSTKCFLLRLSRYSGIVLEKRIEKNPQMQSVFQASAIIFWKVMLTNPIFLLAAIILNINELTIKQWPKKLFRRHI